MSCLYLLLLGLCLFSGLSDGQNISLSEAQADLPQEQLPEKTEELETHIDEDHELNGSHLTFSQDCCSGLYEIGKEVGALSETLRSTISRLEETTRRLEHSEAQLAALSSKERIRVAFTASQPLDGFQTAGTHDVPIVYKRVQTNLGNAYSPISGFFTAPVKGVYSFSFTSFYWGGSSLTSGGSLAHNGIRVVSWYRRSLDYPSSGSNSAVLMLNAGDKVGVYLWDSGTISDNGNNYSSFSGFLLYTL